MKLFPTKCHEQATLRKLWRQTGNSSLLRAKCWPLLHVIAGISAQFSNFAFVLFCYVTNHLMTGPLGNSGFCFPRISMFLRKQNSLFPSGPVIKCLLFTISGEMANPCSVHTTSAIVDLCPRKTRAGKSHDYRDVIGQKSPFSKCFLSTRKSKAVVFKFLRFKERFRKVPFSWRINVDGRPNWRNKDVFLYILSA